MHSVNFIHSFHFTQTWYKPAGAVIQRKLITGLREFNTSQPYRPGDGTNIFQRLIISYRSKIGHPQPAVIDHNMGQQLD